MTIDNPRFAAALIYRQSHSSRKIAVFDDIGCMLAWERHHTGDHTIVAFVHDYKTRQWIRADAAWYLRSPAIQTPMGWGIAAGETQTNSEAAAPGSRLKPMDYRELSSTEQSRQGAAK
jgi:hypothetical protein